MKNIFKIFTITGLTTTVALSGMMFLNNKTEKHLTNIIKEENFSFCNQSPKMSSSFLKLTTNQNENLLVENNEEKI